MDAKRALLFSIIVAGAGLVITRRAGAGAMPSLLDTSGADVVDVVEPGQAIDFWGWPGDNEEAPGDVVASFDRHGEVAPGAPDASQAARNVAAFKTMIAFAEGTLQLGQRAYSVIYGYKYFSGFADHPRQRNTANGLTSDAAGKYQIISPTWDTVIQPALRLPDFSPASQEAAAEHLIKYRGAWGAVIAGDFDTAVYLCRKEWASLPGANYPGQGMRSIASLRGEFQKAGGVIV